jgi:hypothetical protein
MIARTAALFLNRNNWNTRRPRNSAYEAAIKACTDKIKADKDLAVKEEIEQDRTEDERIERQERKDRYKPNTD